MGCHHSILTAAEACRHAITTGVEACRRNVGKATGHLLYRRCRSSQATMAETAVQRRNTTRALTLCLQQLDHLHTTSSSRLAARLPSYGAATPRLFFEAVCVGAYHG